MQSFQSRRRFLAGLTATGAAGLIGAPQSSYAEPPPETTTVRLARNPNICFAPLYIAEEFLRTEGFTDIRYDVESQGFALTEMVARDEIDFATAFAGSLVYQIDAGLPIIAIGGLHIGCYELFAHDPIRSIGDLKRRRVVTQALRGSGHLYLSIIAAHVGLDPQVDIEWIEGGMEALEMFARREADAFLAFPPEPQALRARAIGRNILQTTTDRPWSDYLCCVPFTNREFARDNPVATKRVLRAFLKAADFCAADPAVAARRLVDRGYAANYDFAYEAMSEIPYTAWRDFDVEDSMRFFALRLREVGMTKLGPNELIAQGADWRFFDELKRELKM